MSEKNTPRSIKVIKQTATITKNLDKLLHIHKKNDYEVKKKKIGGPQITVELWMEKTIEQLQQRIIDLELEVDKKNEIILKLFSKIK